MDSIALKDIHPYVRHARTFMLNSPIHKFTSVAAYDWRLIFITKGSGKIAVGEKEYIARKGSMFMFPPGTPYSYYPEESIPLTLIALSFDLSFLNITNESLPLPPVKLFQYKKDSTLMPCRVSDCPIMNDVIFIDDAFQYEKALTDMIDEYETKLNYYNEKMSSMLLCVIMDIVRKSTPISNTIDDKSIKNILGIIRENYSTKLTNTVIGKMLGYHPNHVNRLMIKHTGYSLHDYLINYRISMAINLINSTQLSLSEIATEVGFGGIAHFSACFKQKTGHSPSEYRKGF